MAGLALAATGLTALATSAQAVEVVPRPANGVLSVDGHGFGHGRGMSQWGAYGAATKGLTYAQILSFYYPGTTRSSLANSTIKVRITSDTDGTTEMMPQTGLQATSGSRTVTLPSSSSTTRWRVLSSPSYQLQYYSTATPAGWKPYDLMGGGAAIPGPVTFSRPDGSVVLHLATNLNRQFIGTVTAASYAGVHYSIANVAMETYLRGVVPNEMPASWSSAALQAQAVAARSYSANQRASSPSARPYQTCDSTSCQVFDGYADYTDALVLKTRHTDSRSDAAITSTAGVVLTYGGAIAFTEFSASNGGYTVAGSVPYLVAKPDPYDGAVKNSANAWTDSVSVSTLEAHHPGIGRLVSLTVVRDGNGAWGGRIDTVTLVGSSGSVVESGTSFASEAGFLHRWWAQRYVPLARDLTGDGNPDLTARVGTTGQLRTYVGTGTGYHGAISIGTGWNAMSAISGSGDFTGDGRVDVVARDKNTGILYVYPGAGNGRLGARVSLGSGWGSLRQVLAAGDLSGDGLPDVLSVTSDGHLRLYRGDGAGGLRSGVTGKPGYGGFDRLAGMGDIDGDGNQDVVARQKSTGTLFFYRGNGAGGFHGPYRIGTGWNAMSVIASPGDLTGDGRPDLLAVEARTGTLWLYPGSGLLLGTRTSLGTGWGAINSLG